MEFAYKGWNLADAVIGLMAYDGGATDSGVRDDAMKAAVKAHLKSLDGKDRRVTLAVIARDAFLADGAISEGYGLEDVAEFIEWLDDELGIAV